MKKLVTLKVIEPSKNKPPIKAKKDKKLPEWQ